MFFNLVQNVQASAVYSWRCVNIFANTSRLPTTSEPFHLPFDNTMTEVFSGYDVTRKNSEDAHTSQHVCEWMTCKERYQSDALVWYASSSLAARGVLWESFFVIGWMFSLQMLSGTRQMPYQIFLHHRHTAWFASLSVFGKQRTYLLRHFHFAPLSVSLSENVFNFFFNIEKSFF